MNDEQREFREIRHKKEMEKTERLDKWQHEKNCSFSPQENG